MQFHSASGRGVITRKLGVPSVHLGRLSKLGRYLGFFFIRVPYLFGDPKRGLTFESYPSNYLVNLECVYGV